jgi:tRNA (mo5U34)-methyltransferase
VRPHHTAAPSAQSSGPWTPSRISQRVHELGDWFHNLHLQGIETAPHHFLGDYPRVKWERFAHTLPPDLRGKSVLDIGCNAGFYSLEMKRRGANRVLGIDSSEVYLEQARFAAEVENSEIEFRNLSVYDVGELREQFDIVLFMGVLYHLRHPLLALDLLREHVVKDLLVVQCLLRGSSEVQILAPDYPFSEIAIFDEPYFPRMYFIEEKYSHDETNWWIPNNAALEAMLRSSGFMIAEHPEAEIYLCRPNAGAAPGSTELPSRLSRKQAPHPERFEASDG